MTACELCANAAAHGWWARQDVTHCRRCHATWGMATKTTHCVSCCATFSNPANCDRHQRGTKRRVLLQLPDGFVLLTADAARLTAAALERVAQEVE